MSMMFKLLLLKDAKNYRGRRIKMCVWFFFPNLQDKPTSVRRGATERVRALQYTLLFI